MFAQNNIERWRPLYSPAPPPVSSAVFFSDCVLSSLYTSPCFSFSLLARESGSDFCEKRGRPALSLSPPVHYLYFSVLRASLNTTCSIRKRQSPRFRSARARIFIFHFNFHFSRSTYVHEKGRTLVRNSYSKYTTGRREFTSACRPLDSSCTAKLFSSNYYSPPSNDARR